MLFAGWAWEPDLGPQNHICVMLQVMWFSYPLIFCENLFFLGTIQACCTWILEDPRVCWRMLAYTRAQHVLAQQMRADCGNKMKIRWNECEHIAISHFHSIFKFVSYYIHVFHRLGPGTPIWLPKVICLSYSRSYDFSIIFMFCENLALLGAIQACCTWIPQDPRVCWRMLAYTEQHVLA